MSIWTARVKKKKSDNHYKKASKQGWQGEPEPYSAIEIEMPNQQEQAQYGEELTMKEKVYYYVHTLLAVFFFLFVADKIMNWFQPGYVARF